MDGSWGEALVKLFLVELVARILYAVMTIDFAAWWRVAVWSPNPDLTALFQESR